jgi:dTDP-4-amino-4,6-dideoxygalactose transaminase
VEVLGVWWEDWFAPRRVDGFVDAMRDALRAYLAEHGIGTQIHYPVPIHLQEAAQFLGYRKGDLPVTERVCDEILSIPIYAEMTDAMVDRVVSTITEFMKK